MTQNRRFALSARAGRTSLVSTMPHMPEARLRNSSATALGAGGRGQSHNYLYDIGVFVYFCPVHGRAGK